MNQVQLCLLQGEAEFGLIQNIVRQNMKLYGAEQISLFSDRLLFSELGKQSGNAKAKRNL